MLERLPESSREAQLTLTTDNGTQFTSSRFLETLAKLGITHRRTACHHPEGNSYIERFHRSLKEEGSLDGRVPQSGGSEDLERSLDRGVPTWPAAHQ